MSHLLGPAGRLRPSVLKVLTDLPEDGPDAGAELRLTPGPPRSAQAGVLLVPNIRNELLRHFDRSVEGAKALSQLRAFNFR